MKEIFADDVVIGSGPTGWAACMGVWARGGQPLIIDIGYTATDHTLESVIGNPMVKSKSRFGSEHMYSFPLSKFEMFPPTKPIPLSGAIGGLSTVWGAGIQPVSRVDLSDVPKEVGDGLLLASKELLKKMNLGLKKIGIWMLLILGLISKILIYFIKIKVIMFTNRE